VAVGAPGRGRWQPDQRREESGRLDGRHAGTDDHRPERDPLVAAELLSGTGLGYFLWNAFVSGAYPNVIVAIIAIGVMGYASSALVGWLGARQLPWLQSETV